MTDLIRRMDAIQACQVGPSDEWARATNGPAGSGWIWCQTRETQTPPHCCEGVLFAEITPRADLTARGGGQTICGIARIVALWALQNVLAQSFPTPMLVVSAWVL